MSVDTISVITPSRNNYLQAFNYGIASATAKGELLRQILTQISQNTADIKTLRAAADSITTSADWSALTNAQKVQFSQELDLGGIDHPVDGAHVTTTLYPNISFDSYVAYPPTDKRPQSVTQQYLPGQPGFTSLPQGLYTFSEGTFYSPGPSNPNSPGSSSPIYQLDPQSLQTYMRSTPSDSQVTDYKNALMTAAQDKTQLGQGQQLYMQQIIADKSNFELFATGVLQRLDSLMRINENLK